MTGLLGAFSADGELSISKDSVGISGIVEALMIVPCLVREVASGMYALCSNASTPHFTEEKIKCCVWLAHI